MIRLVTLILSRPLACFLFEKCQDVCLGLFRVAKMIQQLPNSKFVGAIPRKRHPTQGTQAFQALC